MYTINIIIKFNDFFLASPIAILIFSAEGLMLQHNNKAKRKLSLSDDSVGKVKLDELLSYISFINGEGSIPQDFCFQKALQTKKPTNKQRIIYQRDEKVKFFAVNAIPTTYRSDTVVILTFVDITADTKAKNLQQLFIKTVGHELKHPLGLMKVYTYYLNRYFKKHPDRTQQYVTKIESQIKTISKMLDDITDATRFSLKSFSVDRKKHNAKQVLQQIISDISNYYPDRQITYQDHLDKKKSFFLIDKIRIRQAISNLLSNSIKYSNSETPIEIRSWTEGEEVSISVKDYGQGISQDEITQIFDPYYRVRRNQSSTGLGLGLALVKSIIDRHQGKIQVESKLNEYSIFILTIPGV